MKIQKGDKRIIRAWASYDWANSAYALVISSAIFPIFFENVTNQNGNDKLYFLGMTFKNTELYSYALSLSFLIVAILSPLLSSIADYSGKKKSFMKFYTYLGSFSTMMLFFFTGKETVWIGLTFSVLASIGFWGSIVFYNAYLPEIAEEKDQDKVSAMGFAYGYIGSVLLMLFNLSMILKPEVYGISDGSLPARISFLTVGIWWISFAQYAFYVLPDNINDIKAPKEKGYLLKGYKSLLSVLKDLMHFNHLKKFLTAFFLYSFAAQTIFYVASLFGSKELQLAQEKLIITILVIQIVGIFGALGFSRISKWIGNIRALQIVLLIWIGITVSAYTLNKNNPNVEMQFYILAAFVGMVMGSVQALSRSSYSKMLPEDTQKHATYFSFYDVAEKIAIVAGTFSFGLLEALTGSMKTSLLLMSVFFLAGVLILGSIKSKRI
jgi:UMF1 family MFS transporter